VAVVRIGHDIKFPIGAELALIRGGKIGAILDGFVVRHDIGVHAHVMAIGHAIVVAAVIAAGKERVADGSFSVEKIPVLHRVPLGHVEVDTSVGNGRLVLHMPIANGAGLRDFGVRLISEREIRQVRSRPLSHGNSRRRADADPARRACSPGIPRAGTVAGKECGKPFAGIAIECLQVEETSFGTRRVPRPGLPIFLRSIVEGEIGWIPERRGGGRKGEVNAAVVVHFGGVQRAIAFRGAFSAMPILEELEMFYAGALRVFGYRQTNWNFRGVSQQFRDTLEFRNRRRDRRVGEANGFLAIFEMSRMTIDDDKDRCLVVVNALVVDTIVVIPIAVVAYPAIVDVAKREISGLRNNERRTDPMQDRLGVVVAGDADICTVP